MRLVLACLFFVLGCDDGGADDPTPIIVPGSDAGGGGGGGGDMGTAVDMADPSTDAGLNDDAGATDAAPQADPWCRVVEFEIDQDGALSSRAVYAYDTDAPRSDYTVSTDQGADGSVDSIFRIEFVDARTTRTRSDTDANGTWDTVIETDTTYTDDGLTAETTTRTDGVETARQTATYGSPDRDTPAGLFAQLSTYDADANGTINRRLEGTFEGGRLVRETIDSAPVSYVQDTDIGPDGAPEIITTHVYQANAVVSTTDAGRGSCADEMCQTIAPDGTADRVTERMYDDDGRPEMLWAGRPVSEREDFDADGAWDRLRDYTYADHGALARTRIDNDADGTWDVEYRYTYACFE